MLTSLRNPQVRAVQLRNRRHRQAQRATTPLAVAGADAVREWLAGRGLRVVLAAPAGDRDYTAADFTGDLAIVVGSESAGLDDGWRRYPAMRVRWPGAWTR